MGNQVLFEELYQLVRHLNTSDPVKVSGVQMQFNHPAIPYSVGRTGKDTKRVVALFI